MCSSLAAGPRGFWESDLKARSAMPRPTPSFSAIWFHEQPTGAEAINLERINFDTRAAAFHIAAQEGPGGEVSEPSRGKSMPRRPRSRMKTRVMISANQC
jgi:hypothetical protein